MQLAPNSVVLVFRFTTQHIWLVPTVMGLKCTLSQSTDRVVEPLVKALSGGIDRRFQAALSDKEHLIAWISCRKMPDYQWKRRFWTMWRKLQLKVIVKFSSQQLMLHRMTMIFSALWIQQENRQQKIVQWQNRWRNSWNQNKHAYSLQGVGPYPQVARAFVKANSTAQQCSCVMPFQDCWNDPEPEAMQDIGQTFWYNSSAVADMGDCGHNRHGPNRGECCAPFAERWEPV